MVIDPIVPARPAGNFLTPHRGERRSTLLGLIIEITRGTVRGNRFPEGIVTFVLFIGSLAK